MSSSSSVMTEVSPLLIPSIPVIRFRKQSSLTLPITQFAQVNKEEIQPDSDRSSVQEGSSIVYLDPSASTGSCSVDFATESKSSSAAIASQSQEVTVPSNEYCLSFDDFENEEDYRTYLAEINKTQHMRESERSTRLLNSVRRLERSACRIQARRKQEHKIRQYDTQSYLARTNRLPFSPQSRVVSSLSSSRDQKYISVDVKEVFNSEAPLDDLSEEMTTDSDGDYFNVNASDTTSIVISGDNSSNLSDIPPAESPSPLPHMGLALHEMFREQHEKAAIAEKKREAEEKQDLFSTAQSKSSQNNSYYSSVSSASPSAYADGRPEAQGSMIHQSTFVSNQRSLSLAAATAVVTMQQYRTTKPSNAFLQLRRVSPAPVRPASAVLKTKGDHSLVSPNSNRRRLASARPAKKRYTKTFAKPSSYTPAAPARLLHLVSQDKTAATAAAVQQPVPQSILPQLLSEQKKQNLLTQAHLHRMQRQRLEIDQVAQDSYNLAVQLMRSSRSCTTKTAAGEGLMSMIGCVVSKSGDETTNQSHDRSNSNPLVSPRLFNKRSSISNSTSGAMETIVFSPSGTQARHQSSAIARSPPDSRAKPELFASKRAAAIFQAAQRSQAVAPIRIDRSDSEMIDWFVTASPKSIGFSHVQSSSTSNPVSTPTHPSVFSSHHFTLKPSTPLLVASPK